ncbi:MAG: hypothetical protein ABJA94_11245 [Rhodoglobus sp.]
MMPINFTVPSAFSNPAIYERIGAIIKEKATGQIVAHVQEAGGWGLLRHLPIPGGNPLQLVTEGIQMVQLAKIQQTLNTVQTLATFGAVASVASLGVSIAGFAVVLSKLKRMDGKLDQALSDTARIRSLAERLHVKVDALPLAVLSSHLEAVHMAWRYEPRRRRDSLQASVGALATLRHYYAALLSSEEFCLQGTGGLLALLDTHERLIAASEGEMFAEFLLDGEMSVVDERWRVQQQSLDSVAWRSAGALYELAEQGDRDAGVYLVTTAAERRAKVSAVADVRQESVARLGSLPELASFLRARGLSGIDYLQLLREKSADDTPLVAIDTRRSALA